MQNGKSKKKYYGIVGAVTFAALFSIFINEASSEAKKKIQPKKITAEASVQMTKGEKETLSYQVRPKKTTNKKVTFSSSNKKIVTVSKKGALQAKSEGTATITIRSKAKKQIKKKVKISVAAPKKIQRTLPVTVPKTMQPQTAVQTALDELEMSALSANTSITKITLDRTYIKLAAGESDQLVATVFPVTSTEKLTWNCDFFGGINVYQDGRIFITEDTPVGTTATITVFSGKVSATCQIVVAQGPCQHVWGNWAIVENPKCTKEGLRRSICTKCSKVREEPVAATGHNWLSKTVTDATCDAVGEREDTCQNCGEKKREVIPAKGHDWASNGTIKTEPTCTKAGEMEYVCNICKKTKTEPIPANGHSWDLGEITKSPTCTVAGVRTYHCTVDGCAGTKKETIEATGHSFGGWTQTLAPSHGISGLEQRTCSVCKTVQERTVNSGHSYTADGKCNSCSKSFTFVKTTAKDWDYVTDDTAKTILLKKYTGTNTAIKIPAKMDATVSGVTSSYQVVFAGHYEDRTKAGVFASNKKVQIQAVTFENGVQIDNMDYMFSGCESLEVISNIPSTVTSMLGTFKNCTSLCTVSALPTNVENLSNTFEGCESMETAPAIPDDVTSLYATFKKCSSLSAAPTLPSKLTNMDWTFSGCASITAAPVLPDTVTSMTNTFEGCKNLLDIPANIPEGVKKLTMTFYDCDALEMIPVLPNTIEEMEYTFKNCDNLSYAAGLPKNLIRSVGVFDGCDKYEA